MEKAIYVYNRPDMGDNPSDFRFEVADPTFEGDKDSKPYHLDEGSYQYSRDETDAITRVQEWRDSGFPIIFDTDMMGCWGSRKRVVSAEIKSKLLHGVIK